MVNHCIVHANFCSRISLLLIFLAAFLLTGCVHDDSGNASNDFQRRSIDVSNFMTEENIKFDAINNPSGFFTSADADNSTFSDALARQELVQVGKKEEPSFISYLEAGNTAGDPLILVHGQPTQAYLWRKVIPGLPQDAHIIALDMIGYGESSKPDITYTFKQHSAYLLAFIKTLGLDSKRITFVVHDIGSVPALAYASRFPENIKGIIFFEALLGPVPSFDFMPQQAQFFRSPEGNSSIITENTFIKGMLISPEMSDHKFTDEELTVYRKPFIAEEDRNVLAIVPLEVPVTGGAPDGFGDTNIELLGRNVQYLTTNPVPRLFMHASPGVLIPNSAVSEIIGNFNPENSLTVKDMGNGKHFWQEDIPVALAVEIKTWYEQL